MELVPEPFSLAAAVDGVCRIMKGLSTRKQISFQLDLSPAVPEIESDLGKFKQILYNLLSNAVKFSLEGATVTIRTREVTLNGEPAAEIAVIDPA